MKNDLSHSNMTRKQEVSAAVLQLARLTSHGLTMDADGVKVTRDRESAFLTVEVDYTKARSRQPGSYSRSASWFADTLRDTGFTLKSDQPVTRATLKDAHYARPILTFEVPDTKEGVEILNRLAYDTCIAKAKENVDKQRREGADPRTRESDHFVKTHLSGKKALGAQEELDRYIAQQAPSASR